MGDSALHNLLDSEHIHNQKDQKQPAQAVLSDQAVQKNQPNHSCGHIAVDHVCHIYSAHRCAHHLVSAVEERKSLQCGRDKEDNKLHDRAQICAHFIRDKHGNQPANLPVHHQGVQGDAEKLFATGARQILARSPQLDRDRLQETLVEAAQLKFTSTQGQQW